MIALPDRAEVLSRLDEMLSKWHGLELERAQTRIADPGAHLIEPKPPAIYAIGLSGYGQLLDADPLGTERAMKELAWRLDRLVRAGDVLGHDEPDVFLLAAGSVAPSSAGVIMDRIHGAAAMPVEIDGDVLSLKVGIGLAFAFDGTSGVDLLTAAERDLARSLAN